MGAFNTDLSRVGWQWLAQEVAGLVDHIDRIGPVEYNEKTRYLPEGTSPRPGFIRFDLFPFWREVLDRFRPESDAREVNVKKGVQVGYTTLLESILLYYIGHIKSSPVMYMTAESDLAKMRVENNILPMLNESDLGHRIRSADVSNSRKTGQTKNFLQWDGGGFMQYIGAKNAVKMRQTSAPCLLKDELDGWPVIAGRDGNSDGLTNDRARAYWGSRKIFRGSTPLEVPSLIDDAFMRGDRRVYRVLCKACSFPQVLRMEHRNTPGGFRWDFDENGSLNLDSVRYCCKNCGQEHFEYDKEKLFATECGAHWHPTATPKERGIYSYHLPAFYSPFNIGPWYKNISDYLEAYDPENKRTRDVGKYQLFRNNVLGEPFEVLGGRISFQHVSAHRRAVYQSGEVPNKWALETCGSPVLFLTMQVDVHDSNLAASVMGWTKGARCILISYERIEPRPDETIDCTELACSAWQRVRAMIDEQAWVADDGKAYRLTLTLVDAGYANATVIEFCSEYAAAVYPIAGRDRPSKNQRIMEFAPYKTKLGTQGFLITVDHYKDRASTALRREWVEGTQPEHHFNAPLDLDDKPLKELCAEVRRKKVDERTGKTSFYWYRPGSAANELFDLLGYGYAAVEIIAWKLCVEERELEAVDWVDFWQYIESEQLYFTAPNPVN